MVERQALRLVEHAIGIASLLGDKDKCSKLQTVNCKPRDDGDMKLTRGTRERERHQPMKEQPINKSRKEQRRTAPPFPPPKHSHEPLLRDDSWMTDAR